MKAYNDYYGTSIRLKPLNYTPSLNDLWLLGFIEAEGCFLFSVRKGKTLHIDQSFEITQKDAEGEMKIINGLIGGKMRRNKDCDKINVSYQAAETLLKYLKGKTYLTIKGESYKN